MKLGVKCLDAWYLVNDFENIKKDLLFFDKIIIPTYPVQPLEKFLQKYYPDSTNTLRSKYNELIYLEKRGLVEYKDVDLLTPNRKVLKSNYEYVTNFIEYLKTGEELRELTKGYSGKSIPDIIYEFIALDELGAQYKSRYLSAILNSDDLNQEYIPLIKDTAKKSQNEFNLTKGNVVSLVIKKFPDISLNTPIDQILEFKEDTDIQSSYYELRDFITSIASSNLSLKEIEDKIEYLQDQYNQSLTIHKAKFGTSQIEIICLIGAKVIEELATLKFSDALKTIFELRKRKLLMLEEERHLKGREVSYLHKTNSLFR